MKLLDGKVVVCLGPGGVGKTTSSVALAAKAMEMGKRCLVMTIDPSRRLASVLNLDMTSNAEKKVWSSESGGELWGKIIEPEKAFREFISQFSTDDKLMEKLFANKLFKQLSSTLKDSQDFTSIVSLVESVEKEKYDLVILDTPPIQNLNDFFDAPENMYNLFNSKFFSFLQSNSDSKSILKKLVGKGAEGAMSLLAKVTGREFVEELILFFKLCDDLSLKIRDHSYSLNKLLQSDQTGYVFVTEATNIKLTEAESIFHQLKSRNFDLKTCILNKSFPLWYGKPDFLAKETSPIIKREFGFYQEKDNLINDFGVRLNFKEKIVKLPILAGASDKQQILKLTQYFS